MDIHPLCLFGLELGIIALVVGFSSPLSTIRLAALPGVGFCAYGIITTSKWFMRLHWASLLSGCAVGFILQYAELALLSRWSYETHAGTILQCPGEDVTRRNDVCERVYFGCLSTLSFRHVGTEKEVKNTPPFRQGKPPSRFAFVRKQLLITTVCVTVIVVSGAQPPPPNRQDLFGQRRVLLLSRLGEISGKEMLVRIISTSVYWANMWAIMQGVTSFAASIAVALRWSEPAAWKPLFGPPGAAYSLRGFWGKFWHQTLRQILSHPASMLTHGALGIERLSTSARYLKLILTFMLSGILHTLAEFGGGLPVQQSGTMRFFVMQSLGIIFEDVLKAVSANEESPVWHKAMMRLLGYLWVGLFLVWTTPGWLYPDALRPPKTPFLAIRTST